MNDSPERQETHVGYKRTVKPQNMISIMCQVNCLLYANIKANAQIKRLGKNLTFHREDYESHGFYSDTLHLGVITRWAHQERSSLVPIFPPCPSH